MNRQLLSAWGLVLGASFCFAVMFMMPRLSGTALGWAQIAFLRYSGGFVTILLFAILSGKMRNTISGRYWFVHVPRAVMGVGTVGCIVHATHFLPYGDAIAVSFSKGGFVLLFSMLLLGEAVGLLRVAALVLSLSGALLVLSAQNDGFSLAIFTGAGGFALLGAVFMAGEVVLLKLATMKDRVLPMLFWVNGTGMVVSGCLALTATQDWDFHEAWWILLMGPLAIVGQMLNYFGHRRADASFLAPLGYATIVYSVLIGWICFEEGLGWQSGLGIFLVLGGGILSARTPLATIKSPRRGRLAGTGSGAV